MKALPTLRRRMIRSFSVVVVIYAIFGTILLLSLNLASETTPTVLHVNYDSISAARRMSDAWTAIEFPSYYSAQATQDWIRQFESAIAFEETNITEPGEREVARSIRKAWESAKPRLGAIPAAEFEEMDRRLSELTAINEKGMFGLAQANLQLSHEVLLGSIAYFVISLILSILFADTIAERLSLPLRTIAESLHRRPDFSRKLKLPEPSSLEVLILTTELHRLWERLGETEKVNVAQLLDQKGKLEGVLESVEDGLLVVSAQGRVLHSNLCFESLVGLPRERLDGAVWNDLPTTEANYLKLRSLLREGMPDSEQIDLQWKGKTSYFSARSKKLLESGSTLFLLHDISEKKQREKFRSDFIDLLSHELKTPLQSLGTAAELLGSRKAQFNEESRELIETMLEDVERVRAVAQEFVQITQSHAKVLKLKFQLVALNELLPEWIKPFRVLARDRKVRLSFEREGSEVIWANLDLVKFPWVVSNLLSNAIRFSPEGSEVLVRLTDRNGFVEIQVKDQGPGVPEAEQGKIFEPFYQSMLSEKSAQRGLFGLGLTIAREVVDAHDGKIEYYPLKPGSEFRVLLPFPSLNYQEPPEA